MDNTNTKSEGGSANTGSNTEFAALQRIISILQSLDNDARRRILVSAATFLNIDFFGNKFASKALTQEHQHTPKPTPKYSDDTSMSPKDFLLEKQPRSDVERIACLAYYLTYYRDLPHFKTIDLSTLNTEAAQPRFSNAANASNNAVKMGYLVQASKGNRQISAAGEQFVRSLPDRDAAKAAMLAIRPRKTVSKKPKTKTIKEG